MTDTEAPILLTVDELAEATGRTFVRQNPKATIPNAAHAAAAAIHGWKDHAHHTGEAMRLSLEDYEAALQAAAEPPEGKRHLVPHAAALSPYCRISFTAE